MSRLLDSSKKGNINKINQFKVVIRGFAVISSGSDQIQRFNGYLMM